MLIDTMTRRAIAALLLFFAIACGGAAAGDDTGTPTQPNDPGSSLSPGEITGVALDTHGAPIPGAKIWILPALTSGVLSTTTDANGRYTVRGVSNIPYNAYAWYFVNYRGSRLCMRLGSEHQSDYDAFTPLTGAVRNFRWKLDGEMESNSGHFFGGEVRVFANRAPNGSRLIITLVPDGPLVDGSAGRSLNLDAGAADLLVTGIPLGVYKVSAAYVGATGARTALEVNHEGTFSPYAVETSMQWSTDGSCVGSTGSGPDRAFLWVRVPGSEE